MLPEFTSLENGRNIDALFDNRLQIQQFQSWFDQESPALERQLTKILTPLDFLEVMLSIGKLADKASVVESKKELLVRELVIGLTRKTQWTTVGNRNSKLAQPVFKFLFLDGFKIYRILNKSTAEMFSVSTAALNSEDIVDSDETIPDVNSIPGVEDDPVEKTIISKSIPLADVKVSAAKIPKKSKSKRS